MKIGLICAGDTELEPFLPMIEHSTTTEKAMLKFYHGSIEGVEIIALFSGVCKVNAAIAAQILIDTYGCTAVINAGTAGAMDEKLHIFDTVIGTEVAYHDVAEDILTDFQPWMESVYFRADKKLLEAARKTAEDTAGEYACVFGWMVTGEQFIAEDKRTEINRQFAPLTVDMETAAIAHVCYVNKIPFLAVRSITDTPEHTGVEAFEENCEKASAISADFVRRILKRLS